MAVHTCYVDEYGVQGLTDEELVSQARHNALGEGVLAEIGRRQLHASNDLRKALETTSRRLYWLNVVLAVYTVALLVAAIGAIFLRAG